MDDGHVYPEPINTRGAQAGRSGRCCSTTLRERSFEAVPAVEGSGLADVIAGRGMAVGDLFNDGKIDAVINVMDGHPVLLRNVNPDKTTGSNSSWWAR